MTVMRILKPSQKKSFPLVKTDLPPIRQELFEVSDSRFESA